MKMWIARDFGGGLYLFPEKPIKLVEYNCWDGEDWCASYGREGNFVCLNPDAEKPPYNNVVAYGNTPNEALQALYDWCVANGFINN